MLGQLIAVVALAALLATVSSIGKNAEAKGPGNADLEVLRRLIAEHGYGDAIELSENDKLQIPKDSEKDLNYGVSYKEYGE